MTEPFRMDTKRVAVHGLIRLLCNQVVRPLDSYGDDLFFAVAQLEGAALADDFCATVDAGRALVYQNPDFSGVPGYAEWKKYQK